MIDDGHHKFSFRFSGSDRISFSSVTLTSKKDGLVYKVLGVMTVFQDHQFWTNFHFNFFVFFICKLILVILYVKS